MHGYTDATERLAEAVLAYARDRLRREPWLGGSATPEQLERRAGQTITSDGLGGDAALRLFTDVLAPAILSSDHPRYLAFIPSAPTEAAALFEVVVGASAIYGGTWLEASGAVFAENQALQWLADLAGFPAGAGGCFVPGGTVGNLSALVTARETAAVRRAAGGRRRPPRWCIVASAEAHSSVTAAAHVMDVDVLTVPEDPSDPTDRLTGEGLQDALATLDADRPEAADGLFAVVASAGTTNLGVVDDLAGVAAVARHRGLWLHVDGAYGGAALAAPSVRDRFNGIELADSLIVDPHKWLFAPYDCCALIYRAPALAQAAHSQHAAYLDVDGHGEAEWNPSDYAIHLTRRARGLPFWFSLAAHGTRAYTEAIEATLAVARACADEVRRRRYVELVIEPELSIVALRRLGWATADYTAWSQRLLVTGQAFVTPSMHRGEPIIRFAIVNPRTTAADLESIIATLG